MEKDQKMPERTFNRLSNLLQELEKLLDQSFDNHSLFKIVTQKLSQHLDWNFSWWKYGMEERRTLTLTEYSGSFSREFLANKVITFDSKYSEAVWSVLEENRIQNIERELDFHPNSELLSDWFPCMIVPLMFAGDIMGVLMVHSDFQKSFSTSDVALMEIVANYISKSSSIPSDLSSILLELLGEQNQESAFSKIIHVARKLLKAKGAVLYLCEPGNDYLIAEAVTGIEIPEGKPLRKGYKIKFGEGMAGAIMVSDKTHVIENDFHNSLYVSKKFQNANFSKVIEVPLFNLTQEKCGVLAVVNEHEPFNKTQLKIIKRLASQAMLVLEHRKNLDLLKRQVNDYQAFQDIVKRIYEKVSESDRLFAKIVKEIRNISHGYQTTIFLPFRNQKKVILSPVTSVGEIPLSKLSNYKFEVGVKSKEGIAGYVYRTGEALFLDSAESHPAFIKNSEFNNNPNALAVFPIHLQEQVIGVLEIDYHTPESLHAEEILRIEVILQQAAAVIQVNKGLSFVSKAGKDIVENTHLDKMITAINETIIHETLSQGVEIHLLKKLGDTYTIKETFRTPNDPDFPESRFGKSPNSLIQIVLDRDEPLVIPDILNYRGPYFVNLQISEYKAYKSLIGLKLVYGQETLGVIFINFTNTHYFGNIEISFLKQLANQVALGIHKVELGSQKAKQQDLVIEAVNYLSEFINNSILQSENEVLEKILPLALELVDESSLGEVRMLNKGKNSLEVKAFYPKNAYQHQEAPKPLPISIGLTGKAFTAGREIIVNNVQKNPDYYATHSNTKSEAVFPIKSRGEPIGVLNIEHPKIDAFQESDVQLGIAFSKLLEGILEHLRIVSTDLEGYLEMGKILEIHNSKIEVLNGVLKWTKLLFRDPHVISIWEVDNDEEEKLILAEKVSMGIGKREYRKNPLHQGIIGWVASNQRYVLANNALSDDRYFPGVKDSNSELCMPIIINEELFGVFNIEHIKPNAFNSYDVKLAEMVAIIIQIAVRNLALSDDLRNRNIHKSTLLDIVSHELSDKLYNPSLVWKELEEFIPQNLQEAYQDIIREIEDLQNISSNLLDLANIEAESYKLIIQPNIHLDIFSILKSVVRDFQNRANEYNIKLNLVQPEGSISGMLDQNAIKRIASNLIANAIKYSNQDQIVTIKCITLPEKHEIGFSVTNYGKVIPKEEIGNIFERRYRLRADKNTGKGNGIGKPGIGIGLFIARTFCNLHGGRISVESDHRMGTTFTVILPSNLE